MYTRTTTHRHTHPGPHVQRTASSAAALHKQVVGLAVDACAFINKRVRERQGMEQGWQAAEHAGKVCWSQLQGGFDRALGCNSLINPGHCFRHNAHSTNQRPPGSSLAFLPLRVIHTVCLRLLHSSAVVACCGMGMHAGYGAWTADTGRQCIITFQMHARYKTRWHCLNE